MTEDKKSILLKKLIGDKITKDELRLLELEALEDGFLFDTIEGYYQDKKDRSKELEDIETRISKRINQKERKKRIWLPYAVAASLLLMSTVTFWDQMFPPIANNQIYSSAEKTASDEIKSVEENSVFYAETLEQNEPEEVLTSNTIDGQISSSETVSSGAIVEAPRARASNKENVPSSVISSTTSSPTDKKINSGVEIEEEISSIIESDQDANPSRNPIVDAVEEENLRVISGLVINQEGLPLIGANVAFGNQGAVTNFDGLFSFPVQDNLDSQLMISYIGFQQKNVLIEDNIQDYNIELSEDSGMMDEVVVTGYAKRYSTNTSNAVAAIEADDVSEDFMELWAEFSQYLRLEMKRPQGAIDNFVYGDVVIEFDITSDRKVKNFKIVKSLGFGCDREAVRALFAGNNYIPFPDEDSERVRYIFTFN